MHRDTIWAINKISDFSLHFDVRFPFSMLDQNFQFQFQAIQTDYRVQNLFVVKTKLAPYCKEIKHLLNKISPDKVNNFIVLLKKL